MATDIDKAEREIYALVGHEFNIGSPQQLSDILFNELGLPKGRKTTQGYSTDQRALEALRPITPITSPPLVLMRTRCPTRTTGSQPPTSPNFR